MPAKTRYEYTLDFNAGSSCSSHALFAVGGLPRKPATLPETLHPRKALASARCPRGFCAVVRAGNCCGCCCRGAQPHGRDFFRERRCPGTCRRENFMTEENEIEAKKPSPTTDFLPSDGASCSAFQWPFSPHVNAGDTIADAGCMNARRWREIKDIAQPPCPHRTVVAVFPWGLRVTNGTEESDVVDWFLPNA